MDRELSGLQISVDQSPGGKTGRNADDDKNFLGNPMNAITENCNDGIVKGESNAAFGVNMAANFSFASQGQVPTAPSGQVSQPNTSWSQNVQSPPRMQEYMVMSPAGPASVPGMGTQRSYSQESTMSPLNISQQSPPQFM